MNKIFKVLKNDEHPFTKYYNRSVTEWSVDKPLTLNVYLYKSGAGLCRNTVEYEDIQAILDDCTEDWILFWSKNLEAEKEMFKKYARKTNIVDKN